MAKKQIKGVIPPMLTPFKANGDVDYDKHIRNMESWNKDKLAGYLVLGSNSETVYLNEAEKTKLIKLTVKHARKGRMILAGTGVESARETIALTNKAADLGVDAALILTPSYYHSKMNEEAQIRFFTEVADHTRIPVMIYNVTAFYAYQCNGQYRPGFKQTPQHFRHERQHRQCSAAGCVFLCNRQGF